MKNGTGSLNVSHTFRVNWTMTILIQESLRVWTNWLRPARVQIACSTSPHRLHSRQRLLRGWGKPDSQDAKTGGVESSLKNRLDVTLSRRRNLTRRLRPYFRKIRSTASTII